MQQAAAETRELIRALALINGLDLPEERLDVVLRQYQNYLRTLAGLDSLPLPREAEPAIVFSLLSASAAAEATPRR
jgi:hypothetical protein